MSELTLMAFLKIRREICDTFDRCDECPLHVICRRGVSESDEELEEEIKAASEWLDNRSFVPEMGENYWTLSYRSTFDGDKVVFCGDFEGGLLGCLMAINGLCYRTESAALAHAEEDLARIQALYDDMRTEG